MLSCYFNLSFTKITVLPKILRLNSSKIPELSRFGMKYKCDLFDIRVWYESKLPNSLFAISISTKIDKRAVIRNRIKRKLRAVLQEIGNDSKKIKIGSYLFIIRNVKLAYMKNEHILYEVLKLIS